MAYYNVCPHCGCNLDPGEKCDCESIKAREQETSRAFYIERGYEAVGGEYLLIPVVYWGAWKAINYLFDSLEELENERNCRKKRSRGTARMRNYR